MFENIDQELKTGEKALWIFLRFKGGILVPSSVIRIYSQAKSKRRKIPGEQENKI